MKHHRKLELKEKGWSEAEIKHAESLLERDEKIDLHFSKMVFWSALVVIIFANLLISLILIPFLIVLNQLVLYSLIILLAGTIGFLYNFLITDIGHLERKHHVWAGIVVPLIALMNMIIMVFVSNRFITDLQINNPLHNAWLTALIFAVAFIIPYFFDKLRNIIHERRKAVVV